MCWGVLWKPFSDIAIFFCNAGCVCGVGNLGIPWWEWPWCRCPSALRDWWSSCVNYSPLNEFIHLLITLVIPLPGLSPNWASPKAWDVGSTPRNIFVSQPSSVKALSKIATKTQSPTSCITWVRCPFQFFRPFSVPCLPEGGGEWQSLSWHEEYSGNPLTL